ncbi:probable (S)-N-methylcoclaurine 3'-hydroxylase isozyme 2 [Vitis riparia]|uniref:probable (S)-N-methylcoclaurine 3'-hydroxylase isozyme 2 n=1 Tax=Vitis riparia TaxID=96939 RepID=UPI00155AF816|nr:probable (S)-N-methylcoclaurine 3'-hydroxylase isozyme 2 [Vitis riparia]
MDPDTVTADISIFSFLYALLLLPFLVILKHIFLKPPPLPPGPYPWPIIGNLLQMGKNPHAKLANLAKLHGPLMSLRLGTQLMVVASSPAAAMEVLKTHDRALSGRYLSSSVPVKNPKLNHLSIVFAKDCNTNWKNLRAICRMELFSGKAMESQVELRERKVTELVEFLATKEGEVVKVMDLVFTTICNILSNKFFSMDLCDFEDEGRVGGALKDLIHKNAEFGATPNLSDYYPILGGLDIQGINKKAKEMFERIPTTWEDILKERRTQRSNRSSHRDFLEALLEIGFEDDQINQVILELFSAGAETSSLTVEWAMAELIRNQDALDKLRGELRQIVGESPVRESHLPRLPYLQACVKEALRLHPPAPLLLPHLAAETCQVMGYTIPKDSQIFVNIWAMARDPKIWDDPLSFKPERFLDSKLDFKGNDFEYIPFGAGRRICPGLALGGRQVPLILATFVHLFGWSLPGNMDSAQLDMEEWLVITLRKEQPLRLVPRVRK